MTPSPSPVVRSAVEVPGGLIRGQRGLGGSSAQRGGRHDPRPQPSPGRQSHLGTAGARGAGGCSRALLQRQPGAAGAERLGAAASRVKQLHHDLLEDSRDKRRKRRRDDPPTPPALKAHLWSNSCRPEAPASGEGRGEHQARGEGGGGGSLPTVAAPRGGSGGGSRERRTQRPRGQRLGDRVGGNAGGGGGRGGKYRPGRASLPGGRHRVAGPVPPARPALTTVTGDTMSAAGRVLTGRVLVLLPAALPAGALF